MRGKVLRATSGAPRRDEGDSIGRILAREDQCVDGQAVLEAAFQQSGVSNVSWNTLTC